MVAWARAVGEGPTRGQNQGCSCLAGTGGRLAVVPAAPVAEERRCVETS
jgi:hypothetical protein